MTTTGRPSPQNPPSRHHYIPSFYTSAWALDEDGKICQFSRPYRVVVDRRVHPNGTGYADRLYSIEGAPEKNAHRVEELYFKPVDNLASRVRDRMLSEANAPRRLNVQERSAWSRFLLSLLLRFPEDLLAMRNSWRAILEQIDPATEAQFQKRRNPDDPETLKQAMQEESDVRIQESLFEAFLPLIDNPRIATIINGMTWRTRDVSGADFRLLTSDRPIVRTHKLIEQDTHIVLAISPTKLFVAGTTSDWFSRFDRASSKQLVREYNRQVTQRAHRYVYGSDASQLDFVAKHFAASPPPSMLAQILANKLRD